jgi:hypothetical protein
MQRLQISGVVSLAIYGHVYVSLTRSHAMQFINLTYYTQGQGLNLRMKYLAILRHTNCG